MSKQQPHHQLHASVLLAFAALSILLCSSEPWAVPVTADAPSQHVLLKLAPQAWQAPQRTLSDHGLAHWQRLSVPGWVRVTLDRDLDAALNALQNDPAVQIIEPDQRLRIALTPDDTHWGLQWGPEIVHAPSAWDIETGSANVIVAVLDTGIDLQHSDLAGQLWVNPGEIPGNAQDDDQNGYADDIYGWNMLGSGSSNINDDHGHGTHVSGIIAAHGNNGQGIAGMAWGSRVMVVKVLDEYGDGTYSGLAEGLVYAVDNGARVVNLSLGGDAPSQILQDAVDYCHARGTVVIASAGNTHSDIQYPAACDHVLAIAASTSADTRASYSSYGPEMDLTAPGTSIYSTCSTDDYCYKSGTSMAAPHVAGLVALLYALSPTSTPEDVARILRDTAQDLGEPGWDPYTGWGRIDAFRALSSAQGWYNCYLPMIETPYWDRSH